MPEADDLRSRLDMIAPKSGYSGIIKNISQATENTENVREFSAFTKSP